MKVVVYLKNPREKAVFTYARSLVENALTLGVGGNFKEQALQIDKERIKKIVIKF